MNGYGYLIVGIVVVAIIALLATNKKFVETLKNIYKIEELRKRILYTLGLLLVYRLGCFVVIPGINPNAFDGRGNYAMGIKEQLIFPEIEYDKIDKIRGMDIVICTTAQSDEEARELLTLVGAPFER